MVLLPYQLLEGETPEDRFLLWEGVVWMIGLALILFGIAGWFGSTDLYARSADPYANRTIEHNARRIRDGMVGRHLSTDTPAAPWLMCGIGSALSAGAIWGRSLLVGS